MRMKWTEMQKETKNTRNLVNGKNANFPLDSNFTSLDDIGRRAVELFSLCCYQQSGSFRP